MNKNLSDKIKGCFLGYAIGDALGMGTEFMSKEEAGVRYGAGLRSYENIIRDAHRSQWERGDFTLDTEILLRLADLMSDHDMASPQLFAAMLLEWYHTMPMDFEGHFRWVVSQPDFSEHPYEASRRVWDGMGNRDAYNEALGRAMLLGLTRGSYREKVANNCRITHFDPRCVSSAVVIGEMSHTLLWDGRPATYDDLMALARDIDERTGAYITMAHDGNLEEIDLDEPSTFWYTRKTMAAALLAVWHFKDAEEALYTLVDEGGDADTNAALAMGLIALRDGDCHLPEHLKVGLLQRPRIEKSAERFANALLS